MKYSRAFWTALITLSIHLELTGPIHAASPNPGSGIELFREAKALYAQGRYREAAESLEQAYAMDPDPVLLYNLGRCYERLERIPEAIEAYSRYLKAARNVPDRRDLEEKVAGLRALANTEAREQPPAKRPPPSRPLPDPVQSPTARESTGSQQTIPFAIGDSPPPAEPSWLPWIAGGGGVAAVSAGAILGGLALAEHEAAKDAPNSVEASRRQAHAESLATAANVTLISGVAIGIAGLVYWLVAD